MLVCGVPQKLILCELHPLFGTIEAQANHLLRPAPWIRDLAERYVKVQFAAAPCCCLDLGVVALG
jgi:hypothetical protein